MKKKKKVILHITTVGLNFLPIQNRLWWKKVHLVLWKSVRPVKIWSWGGQSWLLLQISAVVLCLVIPIFWKVLPLTLSVEGGKTAKAGEFFADFCAISPRICTCCQCHVGSGTARNWYTGMKPSKMQEGTVFSWASLKGPSMHTVLCYAML